MPLPSLRNVDATPYEDEGRTLVCLSDAEGLVESRVILSPPAFFIATFLDGVNDVGDIQYAFVNEFGTVLKAEDVMGVVDALDVAGLLATDRFFEMHRRLLSEFADSPVRPAQFAGRSYPEDPDELRAFLDEQFLREGGPGITPDREPPTRPLLRGLVVPHIDFYRGGHAYAHGYLRLSQGIRPKTVFVFGVAHATPPVPLVLTRKHFDTPLGTIETDLEIVEALENACAWDPYEHEIVHRSEHSIEFQAVMLAYLFGTSVKMVPVLCGSFLVQNHQGEASILPEVEPFFEACRRFVADEARGCSVIAAADLAHVGQRFGDAFEVDAGVISQVEARDQEDLAHVTALKARDFYMSVQSDHNARRVCGLNCIYSALQSMDGCVQRGEILQYGYAPDPAGGIVSFANIVFT